MLKKKNYLEQEWNRLKKQELKFLKERENKKDSFLNQKLSTIIPPKLQNTLDAAFSKAFGVIFDKGTEWIEKTYKKEELQKDFKINEFANEIKQTRKTLKAFAKKAEGSGKLNLLVSGTAGVGMGLLGIGIPDIPLFTAMVLKSIYEIALNYGYDYESKEERRFILLVIQGAVSYGPELKHVNHELDSYIVTKEVPSDYDETIQITNTAAGLSKELLYMKFIQGIPLVGAVGGFYDAIYMKRITQYANLKYKKRFLKQKKH